MERDSHLKSLSQLSPLPLGIHNNDSANCVYRLLGGCRLQEPIDDKDHYLFLLFIHYAGSTTFPVSISLMFYPRRDAGQMSWKLFVKGAASKYSTV